MSTRTLRSATKKRARAVAAIERADGPVVAASSSMETAISALATAERVGGIKGDVSAADASALVAAFRTAESSIAVSEAFVTAVRNLACNGANRVTCAGAGAIEAVISAMCAHSAVSVVAAEQGCSALCWLSCDDYDNADAIALAAGGLQAIYGAMEAHPGSREVQREASFGLWMIAASPAAFRVMRKDRRAVQLLNTANRNHGSVADDTLRRLDAYKDG